MLRILRESPNEIRDRHLIIVDLGHTLIRVFHAPKSEGNYLDLTITKNGDEDSPVKQVNFTLFGETEIAAIIEALKGI